MMHYTLINSEKELLSFKDIRRNGYHIGTMSVNNIEYIQITSIKNCHKIILEKLKVLSSELYCMNINQIKSNIISNQKLLDTKNIYSMT
jgi:hypothetical protein